MTDVRPTDGTTDDATVAPQRRNTWQREAVRSALQDESRFVTAQELHRILETRDQRIGLATVYRALSTLAEGGEADTIRGEDGDRYRYCETDTHHHHLVCRICGRTVEIQGRAVERWASEMAKEHGYTDVSHVLDVFGVCPLHPELQSAGA